MHRLPRLLLVVTQSFLRTLLCHRLPVLYGFYLFHNKNRVTAFSLKTENHALAGLASGYSIGPQTEGLSV